MTCPTCRAEQPDGARFCNQCGSALQLSCASCGTSLPAGSRFCNVCGTPVPGTGEVQVTAPGGDPAEVVRGAQRRVTSVLFCDLVGFTALSESRDHEETRELLSQYFEDAHRIVDRYGGTVEKFIGDAVMAVWGVPTAHEDDAERAVRAGLELVSRVADMGGDLGLDGLAARVGIVTGEVAATLGAENQGMVAGDAVNTASRVQSVAGPGQVWVDETTRLLSSGAITYGDAGSHLLKGKSEPVPLWSARAVVAARGGAQRADGLEAPHVGRDRELRLVKEVFHGVQTTNRPALLVVEGEAGVGKTRLAWEYEKYVDGLSDNVRWHTGRCLAYGEGVGFYAIAEAVRGRLATTVEDPDAPADAQLEDVFEAYHVDPDEREWLRPRLAVLLGFGQQRFPKEDLFAAWTTFFERIGEDTEPVVLVIDDAQHAEDGLLEFVEHLVTWAAFPLFILMITRPGLLERRVSLATHRNSTVIHLDVLDGESMTRLVDGLVTGLPPSTRADLVARSEGMPLYAVETIRSLIDRDLVVPRGGVYVLADPASLDLAAIGAPASLQALVAARLDTLTPGQRRVVDVASVLGTSMSRDQLVALCPDVDVDAVLRQLVHQQILVFSSSRMSSDYGRYSFQQTVVRQVAHATLSLRDRKKIHLAVIDSYGDPETLPPDEAALLAQHHLDAIDVAPADPDVPELRRTAISLLLVAARRCIALGLYDEGMTHLRTALAHETDERSAALLRLELSEVLVDATSWTEAELVGKQAAEQLDALGEEVAAGRAWAYHATALGRQGRVDEAHDIAWPLWERFREDATATRTAVVLSQALLVAQGRRVYEDDKLLRVLDAQVRLAEKLGDPAQLSGVTLALALRYMDEGAFTLAQALLDLSAKISRDHQLPRDLARALLNDCAYAIGGDAERAAAVGREAIVAARRTGVVFWTSIATLNLGLAFFVRGEWDEMRALFEAESHWASAGDTASAVAVDLMLSLATGEPRRQPLEAPDPDTMHEAFDKGWAHFALSQLLVQEGRLEEALAAAVLATESYTNVYDDFLHMWAHAADLALALDDRAAEEALLRQVDSVNAAIPDGLRAHRTRVAALVADRDGAPAEEVERLHREALAAYDEWGARPYAARVEGELGRWLLRQGRAEEGGDLVSRCRATLEIVGARRWLEQLGLSVAAR